MANEKILDDFSDADEISSIGTRWQGFTDQVMGGRSRIQTQFLQENEKIFLRMQGEVSLENNGGFIQIRLPLGRNDDDFDASDYKGISIRYRTPQIGGYYLHLRTSQTRLPWAHFAAEIPSSSQWNEIRVPWAAFKKQLTLLRAPKLRDLKSIAVVAAKQEFFATIDVANIALY
ncbi:MAG: CIA30 family protein [Spirochaetia bacterium]